VVGKGIPLKGEEDEVMPAIVVGGEGVQNHEHKGTDVLDARRLRVEIGDDGGLVVGGVEVAGGTVVVSGTVDRWEGSIASSGHGTLEIGGGQRSSARAS
jgi:hypothetical protein